MTTNVSVTNAGPVMAIDVSPLYTRALLFDVVEGRYRFIAQGVAPTTSQPPLSDASEGVRLALDQLHEVTGRVFIGADQNLVMPSQPDGNGVDMVVASLAVGAPARVALAGLLDEVSLRSARRLKETLYAQVVAEIGLNDRRKLEEQIDALIRARPDIIVVTGGTNGGARQSVLRLIEAVGLAVYLMPAEERPHVVFAGNQALGTSVKEMLEPLTSLTLAPNVRPALGVEDLGPARYALAQVYVESLLQRTAGLHELQQWSAGHVLSRHYALGRLMRFLSHIYDPDRGVLGVSLNAFDTTLALARQGELQMGVYPELGFSTDAGQLLKAISPEHLLRWLPVEASRDTVLNYLYHRMTYPTAVPVSREEMWLEQALGRELLQAALQRLQGEEGLPHVEPIVVTGEAFSRATPAQALLMVLDSIQPVGVTTVVLDSFGILTALGAIAEVNPLVTVQVLESNAFTNLGTVIAPLHQAKPGTPILRVKVVFEETGNVLRAEVRSGSLEVLPVPYGQAVTLELRPLHGAALSPTWGRYSRTLRLVGGVAGVVVDGRGRPIRLPTDPAARRERLAHWLAQLNP